MKDVSSVNMPNLHNVVDDVKDAVFPNNQITFEIVEKGQLDEYQKYYLYIRAPNGQTRGKVEFLINENPNDPDDTEVIASVLRHGSVSRATMTLIMDSIIERL